MGLVFGSEDIGVRVGIGVFGKGFLGFMGFVCGEGEGD